MIKLKSIVESFRSLKETVELTKTNEFKRWFGNSKVVDASGNPLIMYHGTNKKFKVFNFNNALQKIIWVTSDKSAVEKGDVGAAGRGEIMELYVKIENPAGWDEYHKYLLDELPRYGYDGAILPDGDGNLTAFVFNSNQLKSVNNRGTFDSNNKDITKEVMDAPPAIHRETNKFDPSFIEYIKKVENRNRKNFINNKWYPFLDPSGKFYVIAYGHRIDKKDLNLYRRGISNDKAESILRSDLEKAKKRAYSEIEEMFKVKIPLDSKREEMLVDFVYNLGTIKRYPNFVRAVLNNDIESIKKEYKRKYKTPDGETKDVTVRNSEFEERFLR